MEFGNLIFFGTIVMVSFIFVFAFLAERKKWSIDPNLYTVFGVLGTFMGIFIGLYNFDVKNIETGVPELLQGLRMAFATSIAGMLTSIIIKLKRHRQAAKEGLSAEGATIDTLADLLNESNELSKTLHESNTKGFESIVRSLSGDEEGTLLTQLQKMRTSFLDKNDELINEFKAFAETQAENNSKALIEALEEVIREFNVKITEQFGDNFKQLNEAVGRMLEWQQFYADQIQDLITQFKFASDAMTKNKETLETMITKYNEGLNVTKELENILTAYSAYNKDLQDNLETFSAISDKAKEAIPSLENKVIELTEGIAKSIESSNASVEKSIEGNNEQIKVLLTNISQTVNESSASMHQSVLEQTTKFNTVLAEGMVEIDKNLAESLSKSLQSLGNQMASISNKFADDYTPLAERLRDVLNIVENK